MDPTWTCIQCTLINPLDTTSCGACGAPTDDIRAIERAAVPTTRNQALTDQERAALNKIVDLIESEGTRLTADRRISRFGKKHRHCFTAPDAISYLVRTPEVPQVQARPCALAQLQQLVDADLVHPAVRLPAGQTTVVVTDELVDQAVLRLGRRFGALTKPQYDRRDPRWGDQNAANAGTVKGAADSIRDALKEAVLSTVKHSPHPALEQLRTPDYAAVDRTMRDSCSDHQLLTLYAPYAFLALRRLFGVSEDAFCSSMLDNELLSSSAGGGRSGAHMFFSADRVFVAKSLTQVEARLMRQLLPRYVHYCNRFRDTLLPRFLMLLKVHLPGGSDYMMVTTNVFAAPPHLVLQRQYDLKGSTANRFISAQEQTASLRDKGKLPTLKDLNWKEGLLLPDSDREQLMFQVQSDAKWLQMRGLMDYSLLVGVARLSEPAVSRASFDGPHSRECPCGFTCGSQQALARHLEEGCDAPRQLQSWHAPQTSQAVDTNVTCRAAAGRRSNFQRFCGGLRAQSQLQNGYTQPEAIVYFVAIIDVLQQYDASKQIERFAKVNVLSLMPKFNFKEHAAGNQADCPWCEHSNMVDPETLQHIVTTFQFQVLCEQCERQFDWVPTAWAKDDTNVSAIDPLSYLDRFVQFCSTKVLQPQIATLGRHRRDSQIDDPVVPASMDPHSVVSQTCYQMPTPGQPSPLSGPPPPQSRSTNMTWQPPPPPPAPLSAPNATRNTTGAMPPPPPYTAPQ